jgi:hypothetical protein
MVIISYVRGVSEKFRHVGNRFNVGTIDENLTVRDAR